MPNNLIGTLKNPDNSTELANAEITLTAERTELAGIVKGVSSTFPTDANGGYDVQIEPGFYRVRIKVNNYERPEVGFIHIESATGNYDLNTLLTADGVAQLFHTQIGELLDMLPTLQTGVIDNKANIDTVADSDTEVTAVAGKLTEILALYTILTELDNLGDVPSASLIALADAIGSMNTVIANMDDINALAPHSAGLGTLIENITEVLASDENAAQTASDRVAVTADLATVQGLKTSVDALNTLIQGYLSGIQDASNSLMLAGDSLLTKMTNVQRTLFSDGRFDKTINGVPWWKQCSATSWENEYRVQGDYLFIHDSVAGALAANPTAVNGVYYQKSSDGRMYELTNINHGAGTATETERFRFGKRQMPQKRIVNLHSDFVVIFDADKAEPTPWMVVEWDASPTASKTWWKSGRNASSVSMTDGCIYIGLDDSSSITHLGVCVVSLYTDELLKISDTAAGSNRGLRVSERHSGLDLPKPFELDNYLSSSIINDVKQFRRPGDSEDTIVVANNGGVDFIYPPLDNPTIYSLAKATSPYVEFLAVSDDQQYIAFATSGAINILHGLPYQSEDHGTARAYYLSQSTNPPIDIGLISSLEFAGGHDLVIGATTALTTITLGPTLEECVVDNTTTDYKTPRYGADTVGVYAESSKDLTDLVGANKAQDSWAVPATYDNTITASDISSCSTTGGTTQTRVVMNFSGLTIGESYLVPIHVDSVSAGQVVAYARDAYDGGGNILAQKTLITGQTGFVLFKATSVTGAILLACSVLGADYAVSGVYCDAALTNRHPNATGSAIIEGGTVGREVVAANAETAWYRVGGASYGYLNFGSAEDVAIGVGDFHYSCWFNPIGISHSLLDIKAGDDTSNRLQFQINSTRQVKCYTGVGSANAALDNNATELNQNTIYKADLLRLDGVLYVLINGQIWDSEPNIEDLTIVGGSVWVGKQIHTGGYNSQFLILPDVFRVGSAPSLKQVAENYRKEKAAFNPDAKVLLPADLPSATQTNDLSFDRVTEKLWVAQNALAGTVALSSFKNGIRVDNYIPRSIPATSSWSGETVNRVYAHDDSVLYANNTSGTGGVGSMQPAINPREEIQALPILLDRFDPDDLGITYKRTASATATVGWFYDIPEGETSVILLKVSAQEVSDPTGESAEYTIKAKFYRAYGASAVLRYSTVTVDNESTGTMAASLALSSNQLQLSLTGLASTNIDWLVTGERI